ncbi:uncharacterized protein [Fopius arisanus]|uniref:PolC_1 protein n=1 Tax=Fopius arisanus TaxID=64838 RepID=A0A0C9RJG5_9HYME|nr:PREDICTED: uncharacterized protein LOC105262707 [Fopius arisanus]
MNLIGEWRLIMCVLWNVLVQVALIASQVNPHSAVSTESSEEYLRKAMIELQLMRDAIGKVPIYLGGNGAHLLAGKRLLNTNSNSLRIQQHQGLQSIQDPGGGNLQYYQVPSRGQDASSLLTKGQLHSIYKQAAQGNSISMESLKNVLAGGQLPLRNANNLEENVKPTYAYYFYPMKSFMNDVRNHNGAGDLQMESTNPFHESQKQMVMNPLFMAISGFVGMALVFMLGVLIMPRLFPDFKSRFVHDELLDLTKTVSDAIEAYNKTTPVRPKKHYPEAIIGIKTRPQGASARKRCKIRPNN